MILVKEDLRFIAGYLPYNLQYCVEKHWPNYNDENVFLDVNGYSIDAETCLNFEFVLKRGELLFSNELPSGGILLIPKDYLIKKIIYNGVEIIPIFELFKIATCVNEAEKFILTHDDEALEYYFDDSLYHLKLGVMVFAFDETDNSFALILNEEGMPLQNQEDLFQKLYEMKIDIHNLIEKNKAININTIK